MANQNTLLKIQGQFLLMIDVWLKIRNRDGRDFVLKHLEYWLGVFSNTDKFKVYIYNENFNLPREYHQFYQVLNKTTLLQNLACKKLEANIMKTRISHAWKPAAFALSAPYFYLNNSQYLWNIDADDMIAYGPMEYYADRVAEILKANNLTTMSYDYIYSYNMYDFSRKERFMPQHWTFGINFSNVQKMKNEILIPAINSAEKYIKFIPTCNIQHELNLDVLVSTLLKHERKNDLYTSFITKEGLIHKGYPDKATYWSKLIDNKFHWSFRGKSGSCNINQKTLIL